MAFHRSKLRFESDEDVRKTLRARQQSGNAPADKERHFAAMRRQGLPIRGLDRTELRLKRMGKLAKDVLANARKEIKDSRAAKLAADPSADFKVGDLSGKTTQQMSRTSALK